MSAEEDRPLTDEEKLWVFRAATGALADWYPEDIERGMTDEQLGQALERVLGSCCARRALCPISGGGSQDLGWLALPDARRSAPVFRAKNYAMARTVYCIPDPEQRQLALY